MTSDKARTAELSRTSAEKDRLFAKVAEKDALIAQLQSRLAEAKTGKREDEAAFI